MYNYDIDLVELIKNVAFASNLRVHCTYLEALSKDVDFLIAFLVS